MDQIARERQRSLKSVQIILASLALLSLLAALAFHSPVQDVTTPAVGSPVRKAVLDALREKTKKPLHGMKVVFRVDNMLQQGDWVFFKGKGQKPDGGDLDYHGTSFQAAIRDDMFEDWCCALFKKTKG